MVSIGQYKMMPMAPNNSLIQLAGSKPKLAFSIDSIVGGNNPVVTNNNNNQRNNNLTSDLINLSPRSSSPDIYGRPTSPYSDDCNINYPLELRNQEFRTNNIERNQLNEFRNNNNNNNHFMSSRQLETNSNYQNRDTDRNFELRYNQLSRSPTIFNNNNNNNNNNDLINKRNRLNSNNSPITVNGPLSPESSVKSNSPNSLPASPKNHEHQQQRSDSPSATQEQQQSQNESSSNIVNNSNSINKGPIVVPGIPAGLIRPFPVQPSSNINDIKTMQSPYPDIQPNPHHILAAQFQMAAALAHHGQTAGGHGFPSGAGIPGHPHHPQFGNPNLVRDSYPLYPWLLSRHGRIFPHRFPGHFLLQPFRKPKRVRTAFSPTQLLKLEHAFEGNHYVVGAERKTLAQSLNLTETQVKVWFQNRRTKHKRMQQEDDAKGNGNNSERKNLNDCTQTSYEDDEDDDELIDMDDCPSDQEIDHYN